MNQLGHLPVPLIGPHSLLESGHPGPWAPPWVPRRLEALVGTANPGHTLTIYHWFREPRRPDAPWVRGAAISSEAVGPGALEQRGSPGTADHRLLAHIPGPDGPRSYAWRIGGTAVGRWRRLPAGFDVRLAARPPWDGPDDAAEWGAGTAGTAQSGTPRIVAVATAHTRLRADWNQALVQVGESLYHLHRQRLTGGRVRWLRHACLRLADDGPFVVAAESSAKVAQITGERDSQGLAAGGGLTLSASESQSGVRGTDLGVRIDHAGRSYLLFGDTHWTRRRLGTRDALGEVLGPDSDRPQVRLHGSPLRVRGGGATMREYDVPLDAFSLSGDLFVFCTSNHFRNAQVMGRSILTRVTSRLDVDGAARRRPIDLDFLATFSDFRFINVSVQRVANQLLLWGTGGYRADDVRLARVDLSAPGVQSGLADGTAGPFLAALEFWAGNQWSRQEADAYPLTPPSAVGELSVRWVPAVRRFLMLTMSGPDDPIGPAVVLRSAAHPWGPWSQRIKVFDWIADGMSPGEPSRRFIRASHTDSVGDAIFTPQSSATGAAYAPYLFDARVAGDTLILRYTLSTWNPYQVVLMRHRLGLAELGQPGVAC